MPGKDIEAEDIASEDGYYEDDYLPRVPATTTTGEGYEEEFKKAISVLEQNHTRASSGVLDISNSGTKQTEDELYMKKVNLYRSVASRQSLTRRSIEADLDKLSSSLISSKERWSSQTDLNDEYVQLESPTTKTSTVDKTLDCSPGDDSSLPRLPLRNSQSSTSLRSDSLKGNKLHGSSSSLPLSRTYSNNSLKARRFNRSNTSVDSNSSLPDGWERVEGQGAAYYWHIPSGTTQYQHPSLSCNQDLSEKMGCLQISIPESQEKPAGEDTAIPIQDATSDHDLPPDQHKVLNLGWMEMDISTLKAANSSVAINECIRKLSSVMQDPSQMGDLLQVLVFEGTYLKLLDINSGALLSKQNILTIRRWGVGSDDVRNFAYVVKQKPRNNYRCYVLHCYNPASLLAVQMGNICKQAALRRQEEAAAAATMSDQGSVSNATIDAEPEEARQLEDTNRFETLYLGYIRVEKEKGTDTIHAAIDRLANSNQCNWESVTMEIRVSTINLMKTADRTLLAEHRVRFVSFMALGSHENHLGYIVHGGPKIWYCHVYQSDGSCADMARAIQNACNARYKLLLAKQEETKRTQKPESPGIFSFFKKLRRKSPEVERRTQATKG